MIPTSTGLMEQGLERPFLGETLSASEIMPSTSREPVPPSFPRLMRLESIRGFAAVYVVLNHIQTACDGRPAFLLSFGQEAVILFFILSGFVIHHATCVARMREPFLAYLFRRFRRIYPLFLFALLFSYACSCVGDGHFLVFPAGEFAGNLIMLQDITWVKRGALVMPFCGNSALWSLSYEWWFYMMFYPLVFTFGIRASAQRFLVATVSIFSVLLYQIVPNPASLFVGYFPIWWSGVELSREYQLSGRITWRVQASSLFVLAMLSVSWFIPVYFFWRHDALGSSGYEPLVQLRHTLAAFAALVVGIFWFRLGFIGFRWTLGPFRIIAPISYAIYILHWPPLRQIPLHIQQHEYRVIAAVIVLSLVLALSFLLEARLQLKINRWTGGWLRPLRSSASNK